MTDNTTASSQGSAPFVQPERSAWEEEFHRAVGFYPPRNEAAPGTAPPAAQPGQEGEDQGGGDDQGTAEGAKGAEGGFNWGLFPDVPEELRETLQPHLKKVQAHVTRLEEASKAVEGVEPQQVQSLVSFERAFNQDPMGVWLEMAKRLQETGTIHDGLDLDAVAAYAKGQAPEDDEGEIEAEGDGEGGDPRDAVIQELRDELDQLKGTVTSSEQRSRERVQGQLLERQFTAIKTQLGEAGVPEEVLTNEFLAGQLVTHQGDTDAVIQALKGFRESTLSGFADKSKKGKQGADMPKGVPPTKGGRKPRDAFEEASAGAQQFLRTRNEAAAQG